MNRLLVRSVVETGERRYTRPAWGFGGREYEGTWVDVEQGEVREWEFWWCGEEPMEGEEGNEYEEDDEERVPFFTMCQCEECSRID